MRGRMAHGKIYIVALLVSSMLFAATAWGQARQARRRAADRAADQDLPGQVVTEEDEVVQGSSEAATDNLTELDRKMIRLANEAAKQIGAVMEKWVNEKKVTKGQLFGYLYYPIKDTDPPKFNTDYITFAEANFPRIQETFLAQDPSIIYVTAVDKNGYLPVHNKKYDKPLSGHHSIDLVSNRSKRIFNDRTGISAARNVTGFLLQRYKRDTGETLKDLSVPIIVLDKHWGAMRIGYQLQ